MAKAEKRHPSMHNICSVLFIQNRTHRAGAQTCLARLLRHDAIRRWNPIVLCSPGGWLVEECGRLGVPVIEEKFPSSRSLLGRLKRNAAFGRHVAAKLMQRSLRPGIVHANDHQEGLLALAVAERLNARTAMFLRSVAMSSHDYAKYRCADFQFLGAVGDGLQERAQKWAPFREIALVRDGIFSAEIATPKEKPSEPPDRVLVIGSPGVGKGWSDVTQALYLLERNGRFPPVQFDFTGVQPGLSENDLKLGRLTTARCNFVGRTEHFYDLVRRYDLVINPSRMEAFGMAAVEVVAAGVPLLSSRTGVIEQILERPDTLFPPARPEALAATLRQVFERWYEIDFGLDRAQQNLRRRFLIDASAAKLDAAYGSLRGQ